MKKTLLLALILILVGTFLYLAYRPGIPVNAPFYTSPLPATTLTESPTMSTTVQFSTQNPPGNIETTHIISTTTTATSLPEPQMNESVVTHFTPLSSISAPQVGSIISAFGSIGFTEKYLLINESYAWILDGDETILHISPVLSNNGSIITPEYVRVTDSGYLMAISAKKLVTALYNTGHQIYEKEYRIVSRDGSSCYFTVGSGEVFQPGRCAKVKITVYQTGGRNILEAAFEGVNTTVAEIVARAIYGSNAPEDKVEAVWRLLNWLRDNTSYDYYKQASQGVYTPLEFLNYRKGVCSDYAVFSATTLLGAGLSESYIVVLYSGNETVGHAVALAEVNYLLLVLDQSPPPIEWEDYISHVKNATNSIQLIRLTLIGGRPLIEAFVIDPLLLVSYHPDTYPLDATPVHVVRSAAEELISSMNATLCPSGTSWVYKISWSVKLSDYYDTLLYKAYTPAMREGFIREWFYILSNTLTGLNALTQSSRCTIIEADYSSNTVFIHLVYS